MTFKSTLFLGVAIAALTACNESSTNPTSAERSMSATRVASLRTVAPPPCPAMAKYGPNAVYAPDGGRVCDIYDQIFGPAKDGPAVRNTRPDKNLVLIAPNRLPPRPVMARLRAQSPLLSAPVQEPGNGDEGWFVNDVSSGWGPGAEEVVQPNFDIPAGIANLNPPDSTTVVYAPTNKPRGACIELSPAYYRKTGDGTTTRALGWWDWCAPSPGWKTFEFMDYDWLTTYTVTGYWPPEGQNETQIYWGIRSVPSTNCWEGVLLNFRTSKYETKAYSCGTPARPEGWSMWESWNLQTNLSDPYSCPNLPPVDASIPADTANGQTLWLDQVSTSPLGPYGVCWTSFTYNLDWYIYPGGAHTWRAHTF